MYLLSIKIIKMALFKTKRLNLLKSSVIIQNQDSSWSLGNLIKERQRLSLFRSKVDKKDVYQFSEISDESGGSSNWTLIRGPNLNPLLKTKSFY
jgi:hypothetical protein